VLCGRVDCGGGAGRRGTTTATDNPCDCCTAATCLAECAPGSPSFPKPTNHHPLPISFLRGDRSPTKAAGVRASEGGSSSGGGGAAGWSSPGSPRVSSVMRPPASLLTQYHPAQQPPTPLPPSDYVAFSFEGVFGPDATNEEVYERSGCRDIVESACLGCNGEALTTRSIRGSLSGDSSTLAVAQAG
jgi:hypothetical protein